MYRKKKIGIVDNSVGMTGALKSILNFAIYARENLDFIFILPTGGESIDIIKNHGFKVFEIPFVEISSNFKHNLKYFPSLVRNSVVLMKIIKKEGVNYIHINDFYNLTPILTKIFYNRFSIVTHIRFMPNRFPKPLLWFWMSLHLKFAEHVICVSNAVKNMLPSHKKIKVIYDCLSERIDKGLVKVNQKQEISILYLSHFIKGKGQDLAIESFSRAYSENKNLRMKMVGGDLGLEKNAIYKKNLLQMVKEKGLENIISFHPEVEDSYKEMQAADIFLNFSESESFSMTCLEALSYGVPLIATDSGGPAELFVDGESGFLVPKNDVQAMARAIKKLALSSDLRKNFSIRGIEYVDKKFSEANTFDKLRNLYLS